MKYRITLYPMGQSSVSYIANNFCRVNFELFFECEDGTKIRSGAPCVIESVATEGARV
jgi:hypothetical protein